MRNYSNWRRWILTVTVILFFADLTVSPALSQPHSVTGVAADDVLNIRAGIDQTLDVGGSDIIGAIPYDAKDVMVTGVAVDLDGTKWRQIDYHGTVGWVSTRFLRPTDLMLQTPEALECQGTEPFWTVRIDEAGRSFVSANLEDEVALDYRGLEYGVGRSNLWAHYLGNAQANESLSVIVQYTEACEDGMSGLIFDYEAFVLGLGGSLAPVQGCCRLLLK